VQAVAQRAVDLKIGLGERKTPFFGLHVVPLERPIADPGQPGLAAQFQQMRPGVGMVHAEPRVATRVNGNRRQPHGLLLHDVAGREPGVQSQESTQLSPRTHDDLLFTVPGGGNVHLHRVAPHFRVEEIGEPQFELGRAGLGTGAGHGQADSQRLRLVKHVPRPIGRQAEFKR
jgi:hypothetical protein